MDKVEQSSVAQAFVMFKEKRYDEARVVFSEAMASGHSVAECLYGLGLINLTLNDVASANRLFESCVVQQPSHANAHYYLGHIAEASGRRSDAIRAYRQAVQADSRHTGALAKLKVLDTHPTPTDPGQPDPFVIPPAYPPGPPTATSAPEIGGHDLYGLIHRSAEPVEQEIMRLMDGIEALMSAPRRARMRAFLGRFFSILLLGFITFTVGVAAGNSVSVWLCPLTLVVFPILLVLCALSIRSHSVASSRYVIVQKRGLLSRTTQQDHLWLMSRDQPRTVTRTILNRITNDGTLRIGKERYTGLFNGAELEKIQSNLAQLALLMPTSRLVLSAMGELKNIRSGT